MNESKIQTLGVVRVCFDHVDAQKNLVLRVEHRAGKAGPIVKEEFFTGLVPGDFIEMRIGARCDLCVAVGDPREESAA